MSGKANSGPSLPYVVAVTGGIASGKSAVTDRLQALGAPVIDADRVSRELVEPGQPALAEIVAAFGPQALDAHGRLDRRHVRELVFASAPRRRRLEAILHPRVRTRMRELVQALPPCQYCILAIPLLAEAGRYPWIDCVVVVDAPPQAQLERLVRRDGVSPELARSMIAAQATREERLALADEVVINDGSLELLLQRVDALHQRLLVRAERAVG